MKIHPFRLMILVGIISLICPRLLPAQDYEDIVKKLTQENRALTQENNILKKRIRQLEAQLGEDSTIHKTYLNIQRINPQDVDKNDRYARDTLRTIAGAAEKYAEDNYGSYPGSIDFLRSPKPYLKINYCGQTMGGFEYTCETSIIGYTITATPVEINVTGSTVFTITTGGYLSN